MTFLSEVDIPQWWDEPTDNHNFPALAWGVLEGGGNGFLAYRSVQEESR